MLARHGETEWSATGRHTGLTDIPLTRRGEDQARALAPMLAGHRFALVLASPLARAQETARLAGFGDRVVDEPDLVEWDYGDYEGRTTPEIRTEAPGWTIWDGVDARGRDDRAGRGEGRAGDRPLPRRRG